MTTSAWMTIATPTTPPARRSHLRALGRFWRAPKGLMLLALLLMLALTIPVAGLAQALPGLLAAMIAATLLDALLLRLTRGAWEAPTGALLSALFVAMILDPHTSWYVTGATAVLAINSKYLLRTRWSNVVNPAACALLVNALLFGSGQNWWGALPDLPLPFVLVLFLSVAFIAARLNKLPVLLIFLAVYFGLATLAAFAGAGAQVAELFRVPNSNMVLFFAGFMLTDPPTSPARVRDQRWYALIVASASIAIFLATGGVYYFLSAALLIGNLWESARRLLTNRRATHLRQHI